MRDDITQFKLDAIWEDSGDSSNTDFAIGSDLKLLPDLAAKDLGKMAGVATDQGGPASGDFVRDPATTGHEGRLS